MSLEFGVRLGVVLGCSEFGSKVVEGEGEVLS